MADYNLNGLNPRDFQHIVQALARKRIAAGVTAFGDGKDGNRDLTYHGRMDYPSAQDAWDGYLVLGCKFGQRPTGDTRKDADWAVTQLTSDLQKFLDPERNLPKPDYYIFTTNIALTGVAESGGRDRVTAVLEGYRPRLGLKGYACWDYNDLRGFLDGDKDIRTAYGHFITAGDVLSLMVETLQLQRANFADVMHTFLQKELLADMSAKLQSAGEDPELQIPLANVFVDLPVADSAEAAVLPGDSGNIGRPKVIDLLMQAGTCILRHQPLAQESQRQESQRVDEPIIRGIRASRFVLVGGPGQGKSTLGQYLCQLYRASILKDRPRERLDDRVPSIIRQLEQQREEAGGLPLTRRFPLRIELRTFADALMNNPQLTLLEYLCGEIARFGSATIHIEDLKNWLGSYPWLLVLDGLDEVPSSSNREDVMRQVEYFRVDAASQNADILMVITTRPQSYSKEFPSELFQHLYLAPLSPKQALDYGQRLAWARCGGDERRCEEVVRSLEKACETEMTARLMQNPLQITIMATLLEETGEPPQQRYRLFAEYYRTIYKRETRRRMLGGILSERQTDIDTIHAEAGLLLHAVGERATQRSKNERDGDNESALSDEQFRKLVYRRLARIKVPEPRASDWVRRITDGTLQRLVFLVRLREGWIRFDLTSLKEFMAAEALMTGPDDHIRERLMAFAPTTYWRNVLLFAVGKCFVEKEYLLDNVVSICEGLNDDKMAGKLFGNETTGTASKTVLWGSRLALDILADGTARQNPEYESRLAKTALELVRLSEPETAAQLAAVYHGDLTGVFQETIEDRLGQADVWRQLGAWLLLMSLADRDVGWAKLMVENRWPCESTKQQVLLLSRRANPIRPWALTKLIDVLPYSNPGSFFPLLHRYDSLNIEPHQYQSPDWWPAIVAIVTDFYRRTADRDSLETAIKRINVTNNSDALPGISSCSLISVDKGTSNPLEQLQTLPLYHSGWAPLIAAARFCSNPTSEVLKNELEWLAKTQEHERIPLYWWQLQFMPWPLAACLWTAKTNDGLQEAARWAAAGRLGTFETWKTAEERWRQRGITDNDFHAMTDDHWPFDERIAERGFPFVASICPPREESFQIQIINSLNQFHQIPSSQIKAWLASTILSSLSRPAHPQQKLDFLPLAALKALFHEALAVGRQQFPLDWPIEFINTPAPLSPEWIDFLDWLGRRRVGFYGGNLAWPHMEQLVHSFSSAPEARRGLLPLLAALAVSGNKCEVPREVIKLCRNWDDRAKDDAVLLSLAREDWLAEEATELAQSIIGSKSNYTTLWRAFRILERFPRVQVASFALVVLRQLSVSSQEENQKMNRVMSVLTEYMTKRSSPLGDHDVWRRLALPEPV